MAVFVSRNESSDRLLEMARATPYHATLTFMARTGVRRGESLGLQWGDVDLDSGTASILRSLQRIRRLGLLFTPPKSSKGG